MSQERNMTFVKSLVLAAMLVLISHTIVLYLNYHGNAEQKIRITPSITHIHLKEKSIQILPLGSPKSRMKQKTPSLRSFSYSSLSNKKLPNIAKKNSEIKVDSSNTNKNFTKMIQFSDMFSKAKESMKKEAAYKQAYRDAQIDEGLDKKYLDLRARKMIQSFKQRAGYQTGFQLPKSIPASASEQVKAKLNQFYKRVRTRFINSCLSTLIKHTNSQPNQPLPVDQRDDLITLKVTYDYAGNLTRVLTIEAGKRKLHRNFFNKAIHDIKSIPNPPKLLLNERNEFEIFYTLRINPSPPPPKASTSASGNLLR